jgi:hypothetical protein
LKFRVPHTSKVEGWALLRPEDGSSKRLAESDDEPSKLLAESDDEPSKLLANSHCELRRARRVLNFSSP